MKNKKNFWEKIKKPIYALAPMAGVADSAFRQICKRFGADVVYSEMVSATGLVFDSDKTWELIRFDKKEKPFVVQLFGSNPDHFAQATKLISKIKPLGGITSHLVAMNRPDGIDINFGCPVKKVAKQGAGAVLMDNPKLAREIIKSVIDNTDLPVSVKLRSKVGSTDVLKFLDYMNDLEIKAVMIHGRTMEQGFSGPIDPEIIKKAREYFGGIILANGGVHSHNSATLLLEKTQADGIGIARGALGRPWIFKALRTGQSVERAFKLVAKEALNHAQSAYQLKGDQGILEMRKHLCWYVHGFPGAKESRKKLVLVTSIKEIEEILYKKGQLI